MCCAATSCERRPQVGLLFGVGAYAMWGLFPAFFPLLKPAGALEVLAHRIVWSFVLMVVVIAAVRRLGDIRAITPRTWLLLTFASALISVNWVIYIYAVNNGHVVDAALGYFINPLVTVALGLLIFRERLNRAQFVALAIAVVAVVVLTVEVGAPPGHRSRAGVVVRPVRRGQEGGADRSAGQRGRRGCDRRSALLSPSSWCCRSPATATFTNHGPGHIALMILSGVLTALPLLFFAAAAPAAADGDDGAAVLSDPGDAADLGRGRRARADAAGAVAGIRADLGGAAGVQRRRLLRARVDRAIAYPIVITVTG